MTNPLTAAMTLDWFQAMSASAAEMLITDSPSMMMVQQADPLDQVRRVRRYDLQPPVEQHQGGHVEHDPGIEDQVAPRRLQQDRGKTDSRADGEHGAHLR